MRWKRKKKRAPIERATAAPGEYRRPATCPRCLEENGPGHESYPCVDRSK